MSRILTVIGLLLMLHSAISIGQFRGIIRERGGTEFNIPSDILIEVPPLILFPVQTGTRGMSAFGLNFFSA